MPLNPRMADWAGCVVWLIGASSGIGQATAHALHQRGALVVVSARRTALLEAFAAQHPGSQALTLDASDAQAVRAAAQQLKATHGKIDLVLVCAGHYSPQRATAFDLTEMLHHQQVNYVGALNCLAACLPILLAQGYGHVSLVASVAGYRGLPQALAYGPTKAALQNLAEILYLDLHDQGLGVSLINPGFVKTGLTAQNDFTMPALISPDAAAVAILKAWAQGQFEIHFPKRFTLWLKLLRCLPYGWYFALVKRVALP